MKQVAEMYTDLVAARQVAGIRRYNLRRFCRSLNLPPCGVSFWYLDDLNFDYLRALQKGLAHERFWFQGGEHLPRPFFDNVALGHDRRTEFIFLCTRAQHHGDWAHLFQTHFNDSSKDFGSAKSGGAGDGSLLRPILRTGLHQDLIHFGRDRLEMLATLGEFYLCLLLMTWLPGGEGAVREKVYEWARGQRPELRADLTRVETTRDPAERLEDILHLMSKLD